MKLVTRFTIDVEDMTDTDAGGLGLWLEMMLREETEHTVHQVSYQRLGLPERRRGS